MRSINISLILAVMALGTVACDQGKPAEEQSSSEVDVSTAEQQKPAPVAGDEPSHVVNITAQGLEFTGPDEIKSGWTTFELNNDSAMVHFAVLERLPEGKGLKEQQEEIAPVFQEGMDLLNEGKEEAATEKFGELPEWFGDIVFMGGPGLVAANQRARSTVHLEPGTYILECYVKTGGIFHSFNPAEGAYGMVHEITVTDDQADMLEPEPTIHITISSDDGIEVEDDVAAGEHTVAVLFADQKLHEHFLGHDVHLARLEQDSDIETMAAWMDWRGAEGLETPAPVEFLGGTHEMAEGETGYFHIKLTSGRYAWIAEVPNPESKGMLKIFTVP